MEKAAVLQPEAGAAALSSISMSLLLFPLRHFSWEDKKTFSEPDRMPYAKVEKDRTSSMPVLQDETTQSLTGLRKAEGRQGAS